MKIVSSYVREQMRYTKKELKTRFDFDEAGVEIFIKRLKDYGILKTVSNNKEQKEMTDLVAEDIQILNETMDNEECLYVFTFVGIITCGNRIVKVFPKYLLKSEEPLKEMKQVIKVLEQYSNSDEQIINAFNGDGSDRTFNILAVILFLLNDYHEYGIYNNIEDVIEVNGDGEILWGKTIDECFPLIENERPYYMEMYTRKTVDDETDYFRMLHEFVLTECSRQLQECQLDGLFDMERIELSEETLEYFGERDYILERIQAELSVQFSTRKQILLKTLYAYVSHDKRLLEEKQGISMYGTNAFNIIWEKVCADVFDNKLNTPIGNLGIRGGLAPKYRNLKKRKLIELIKKPEWIGINTLENAKETLIPDLITIQNYENEDWFIIFDAKYYNLQLEKGKKLRGNPGVGDVTKQYLYQLAYKDFIQAHEFKVVKNCFLMPTAESDIIDKGMVRMEILEGLGLENIHIRMIPAEKLFDCYLKRRKMDLTLLNL